MNNNYYDEFLAEYVLNSPHPELITVCGGFPHDTPVATISLEDDNPHWAVLTTVNSEPKIEYLKPELAICECCGAPLEGNKCEYCGSTYIWR